MDRLLAGLVVTCGMVFAASIGYLAGRNIWAFRVDRMYCWLVGKYIYIKAPDFDVRIDAAIKQGVPREIAATLRYLKSHEPKQKGN